MHSLRRDSPLVDTEFHRNLESVTHDASQVACRKIPLKADLSIVFTPGENGAHEGFYVAATGNSPDMCGYFSLLADRCASGIDISIITAAKDGCLVYAGDTTDIHVFLRKAGTMADTAVILAVFQDSPILIRNESDMIFDSSIGNLH